MPRSSCLALSSGMPDETVRLTYTELAKARGITLAAARRLTLRHKWRKQLGNDGLTHIWVPLSALPRDGMSDPISDTEPDGASDIPLAFTLDGASIAAIAAVTRGTVSEAVSDALSGLQSDVKSVIPPLHEAITTLRVQLYAEKDRADRAEKALQELQAQRARRWWPWRRS